MQSSAASWPRKSASARGRGGVAPDFDTGPRRPQSRK
jgi:hypothetical protein